MPTKQMTRKRNPRGQGERLRDDIIEAASRLLADPAAPPLTLRAVAREVGVAATSVYLHFDSIDTLTLATVNHLFAELLRRQDALTETDPCERVLARGPGLLRIRPRRSRPACASPAPSSPGRRWSKRSAPPSKPS